MRIRSIRSAVASTMLCSALLLGAWPALADDTETRREQALALEVEANPQAAGPPSPSAPAGVITGGPLFIGVDDVTVPAYRVDTATSAATVAFNGFQVWGAAYDPVGNRVLFNNGSTLYEWPVGGSVNTLGTIVDAGAAQLSMTGLAFHDGTLYACRNIANEAVYTINLTTLVATVLIDYADADFDCGGLAVNPADGMVYMTNDDTTPLGSGLFRMNMDGTGTLVAPYPAGQTDIDGLAIGNGRAYLVIDEPGDIFVWDFGTAAYVVSLTNPWTTSTVFSAGAFIDVGAPNAQVSPGTLAATQPADTTTQQVLTIANTGGGSLDWTLFEQVGASAPDAGGAPAAATAVSPTDEASGIERSTPDSLPSPNVAARARALRLLGSTGLLLIPDSTNDRIMAFDPETGNLVDADFVPANSVVGTGIEAILSADGNSILLSDQIGDVVHRFDLDGNYVGVFAPAGGANTAILDNIRGIALDDAGNLLVTVGGGTNADAVARFDTSGNSTGNFIANGAGGLDSPFDIYRQGNEWLVAGIDSDNILRYDLAGSPLGVFAAVNTFPEQIAGAGNGNVLVANFSPAAEEGVIEFGPSGGAPIGRYDPAGLGGYRGVYELGNGNILTTTGAGVHEIDRAGNLVSTKISGVSARFISFVSNEPCSSASDIPWLSFSANGGSTPGGGSSAVTVTFDSTGLPPGSYTGNLCVSSNDPDAGPGNETDLVIVPVSLTVQVTDVPPVFGYAPATGSTVTATGGSTIGSVGSLTITPSIATAGSGTGSGATTTLSCTAPTAPFAGFAQTVTAVGAGAISGGPLAGTCTLGATAVTQTLTCSENRGGTPIAVSWTLSCPAGTPVAPIITYDPSPGSTVGFTGVTTIGTAGNGTIVATPSGGLGSGAGATTTVNGCTLGGANPGAFAGAAAVSLSFVGSATTSQSINLTCTSAAAAQTATLTCNETRGSNPAVQRQWPLNCPAGTLLPLTSNPASGSTVSLTGTSGGSTSTSTITVTNPNPIAVSLTCTAPGFPFTATPLAFSIPASGNAPVTVGISPAAPGSYSGTLACNVAGSSQVLTFSLAGTLAPAVAINATSAWSLVALMLALFGFAAVAVRRQA